jgi:hypothetical protein
MSTAALTTPTHSGANRRYSSRRSLRLGSVLSDSGAEIIIHDISAAGMLIETSKELTTGETLVIDLPERGEVSATVSWNSGQYFGCQFEQSIPAAAVSAALLRSAPVDAVTAVGNGPDVSMLNSLVTEAIEDEAPVEDDRYSLRTRGLALVGLCGLSWTLVGSAISLILS